MRPPKSPPFPEIQAAVARTEAILDRMRAEQRAADAGRPTDVSPRPATKLAPSVIYSSKAGGGADQ